MHASTSVGPREAKPPPSGTGFSQDKSKPPAQWDRLQPGRSKATASGTGFSREEAKPPAQWDRL
jgi:hypothetical protein